MRKQVSTNNGIKGVSIFEDNGREYFLVLDSTFNNVTDEEKIIEATNIYNEIKYFEIPENKTALETSIKNIDVGIIPGSLQWIEAVKTIRQALYKP